ncbi:sigma 54-interacting transcriptional regulator [Clostridium beijerinckii]|uniref:PTS sugar transporter n=2 Tax=Clostridium beijerinckii TaxID=1520 RepID=A0A1S9N1D2_CLOBE|nr:sigma 54-interacting transcriptional regulator [Clostridium beijerinckii]MZK50605.1 PTS transporter subunit EIIA [Clostridium beijerinckii]MZK58809.1 PTS transporter subunit EIIA [Clostridium beijerinckii]MZK68809.1 PTS transporter subunit EIIA [Clostridium beijerinckii]MZK74180.1 PTS transporter subunit EIIA [Clostridium beijerinckii]MZK82652.1 PTS transporter subunit EIIA [Clostridium beijerinckii]
MDLENKIIKMINTENKKNPLTDAQIAKFLGVARESITNLRKELNIPNSRQRRYPYLKVATASILKKNKNIAVSELTRELLAEGFDVSRRIVEEILAKDNFDINKVKVEKEEVTDAFNSLIGSNGSLKNSIEQAKSAILYPPKGLTTLIVGESGVGKSKFSECMYEFAKKRKVIKENASFVVFNCADYGDNPQLLLSLLFGHKKGAFTGADTDASGLVEEANGGVLFLDEIHRLPPKGQEILFSIMDRGKFRRLGEANSERKVNLMLIGATTENIEANLLLTFRRRIPMVIKLSPLHERPVREKIDIIYNEFQSECNRIDAKIFVDKKVVEILALKKFSANIGQLQNMIQVLCARAFMTYINNEDTNKESLIIDMNQILKINDSFKDIKFQDVNQAEIRKYVKDSIFIPFMLENQLREEDADSDENMFPEDIYRQIEKKYYELKRIDIRETDIENILWAFIQNSFTNIETNFTYEQSFSMNDLRSFVSEDLIDFIETFMKELSEDNPLLEINKNVFKYLAIHVEESIKRIRLKQKIINVDKIISDTTYEYEMAKKFVKELEEIKNIEIPNDEIGFIGLYIKAALRSENKRDKVGLMIISHGKIATATINVVNELLGIRFPVAVDMPLDENPINIYNKVVELSKIIDQGKGILFLVDMGSLTNIGDIVNKRTGIKSRTIDRVDLIIALEAARKVSIREGDLDEIYFSLIKDRLGHRYFTDNISDKPKAIISLCLTGEGMAKYISKCLGDRYDNVNFYEMSALDENLSEKIIKLKEVNNILAVIGTIDPEIQGINFIPYDKEVLNNLNINTLKNGNEELKYYERVVDEDLLIFEPDIYFKKDLLEYICSILINKGIVDKEYLSSVINRESLAPTYLKGEIAVPHGESSYVNKTSFVFIKVKSPIDWGVGNVNIICMPVFKANGKVIVKNILKILEDKTFINDMKNSLSELDFKNIILNKFKEI